MDESASLRTAAPPGGPATGVRWRLLRAIIYGLALLAGAVVAATLILVALDGHPAGLLTIPAAAAVPAVLWCVWRLHRTPPTPRQIRAALRLFRTWLTNVVHPRRPTRVSDITVSLLPDTEIELPASYAAELVIMLIPDEASAEETIEGTDQVDETHEDVDETHEDEE